MDLFKSIFTTTISIVLLIVLTYGIYWVFKTVSYELFYESMVQDTIRGMIKPEYLKGD